MTSPAGFGEVRTSTHVYRTQDLLGIGSSCEVFTGLQKTTGEEHALKIFKDTTWANSEERRREVTALRRLKHPNIVQFFGEEEEAGTGRQLLVLELCSEGSLHTYLREPENSRGLHDSEFLLLLKHLSSALRYLHGNNYVHRDIKPGNILRFIDFDGECVYKLSDFGASRLLADGDMFMSLAGTEEYLHPAVYEKAFMDRGAVVCFDSSVDFWSTGCTYYQTATGLIPFRPHGGVRNNRGTMFKMIAEKPDGVISGHQETERGEITWEKHIPASSRLSEAMRILVRNLISRLMEKEQTTRKSHDQYQQHVQIILQLVQVVIFNTEEITFLIIYIKPNCTLAEFQDQVAGKTDIMADDQLLYHKGRKLSDLTSDGATVDRLPCDYNDPVILLSRCQTDACFKETQALEPPPSFHSRSTQENDYKTAHKMASFVIDVQERITTFIRLQNTAEKASNCAVLHLEKEQCYLEKNVGTISVRLQELRARQELMEELEKKRVKVAMERNSSISQRCKSVRSAVPKLQEELKKVKLHLLEYKQTTQSMAAVVDSGDRCSDKCVTKARSMGTKSTAVWRDMHSKKKHQPLSERQQLCHTRDRRRMVEICTAARSLLHSHCQTNWNRTLPLLKQHLEWFHGVDNGQRVLVKKVTKLKQYADQLEETLIQTNAFIGRAWNQFALQIDQLKLGLISIRGSTQEEIKESRKRMERFETLVETLPEVEQLPPGQFDREGYG